jgi:hypothetical protein
MVVVLLKLSHKLLHQGTSFKKSHQWIKHNPKFFGCLSLYNFNLLWKLSFASFFIHSKK